ncbi:MAG: rhodanese-like domain-containing protein, partial [Candidatus Binataceae bacterium]
MAKTSKNILDEARAQIKSIDIDEARRMLEKPGTVLLDVREGDEWRQGHIPQAIGIPRGFL